MAVLASRHLALSAPGGLLLSASAIRLHLGGGGVLVGAAASEFQNICPPSGWGGDLSFPSTPCALHMCGPVCRGQAMVVTWLILPVVICLSQRLSHACLSINKLYSETANGSLNQLSFI